jgi:16S rRNA pseudouridine516 synthase
MRLDKYLCHATGLTRSRAQGMIRSGQVTVDNEVVKAPDFKLPADATVAWREQAVSPAGKRYYMLYKPSGVVCATVDDRHRTVIDLLNPGERVGLHIAGRLDIDATGLVLLTDDGDWSHRVTSPKRGCGKTYRVTVAEPLAPSLVEQFAEGVALRNEKKKTRPAQLEITGLNQARLTISEGKYHQVKRMFAALGNRVTELHRERIGALQLDPALQPGEWRSLTEEEIEAMQQ